MTDAQKLLTVKTILSDGVSEIPSDDKLSTYIEVAGNEILSWRWQLVGNAPASVPAELEGIQVYAVVVGYTQAGAEGEQTHIENGVHRHFRYSEMLDYIHNKVGVIGKVYAK